MTRMRRRPVPSGWAVLAAAPLYAAALVVIRGRPTVGGDSGIFLSVAARLVHGDSLYRHVWDNKPPFFYYAEALALAIAGWRGPFLIDVFWISLACVSVWFLLGAAEASTLTRAVGAISYPLFLTGAWYYAGYSELPPLALAPAVASLWLRGNAAAAGALLGVLAFSRPDYGLIFAALIVAPLAVRKIDRAALRRNVLWLLAGLVIAAAASCALLAARGELTAYFDTMRANIGYPNRALVLMGYRPGVLGHVTRVRQMLDSDRPRGVLFAFVVLVVCVLLAAGLRRGSRARTRCERQYPRSLLTALLVGTAVAAGVTLALTALWDHNLELIALPATFATCLLAAWLETAVPGRARRLGAIVATTVICLIAFGALSLDSRSSPESNLPLSSWTRTPRSPSAIALDEAAVKERRSPALVTYARLGNNHDDGHAEFIDKRLKLACPVFHQYTFSSNLDEALTCIRRRRPELMLVGPFFVTHHHPTTRHWNAFVTDSRRLLRAQYVDVLTMTGARGGTLEVWRRR